MSKEFTKEDVIQNKKEAIKCLNKMLESFINAPSEKHLKKAHLISYWIKDYIRMINFEEHFEPTKNITYKRGNIVKINFGFNIGSEYGGLHYGVVLDKQNDHNSPVLTVIPLTSVKDGGKLHKNNVTLGDELYRSLKLKYDTISKMLKEEQADIKKTIATFSTLVQLAQKSLDSVHNKEDISEQEKELDNAEDCLKQAEELQKLWVEKQRHNQEQQAYLTKIGEEISRMKEGSIALVSQITTVSKIRIFDPKNLKGVLANVSLSEESMEKINQKMVSLYVFQKAL